MSVEIDKHLQKVVPNYWTVVFLKEAIKEANNKLINEFVPLRWADVKAIFALFTVGYLISFIVFSLEMIKFLE